MNITSWRNSIYEFREIGNLKKIVTIFLMEIFRISIKGEIMNTKDNITCLARATERTFE